jgi:hypothetical protein
MITRFSEITSNFRNYSHAFRSIDLRIVQGSRVPRILFFLGPNNENVCSSGDGICLFSILHSYLLSCMAVWVLVLSSGIIDGSRKHVDPSTKHRSSGFTCSLDRRIRLRRPIKISRIHIAFQNPYVLRSFVHPTQHSHREAHSYWKCLMVLDL